MCGRYTKKILTLVFVTRENRWLLGLKKRGFGEGKWNGFGGKVERGESIEQAAARELQEECNIVSDGLDRIGLLDFEFKDDPVIFEVHVFKTNSYRGEIKESEEMLPKWFNAEDIPYSKMWLDDTHWFPFMLQGFKFYGYFLYHGHNKILRHRVKKLKDDVLAQLCAASSSSSSSSLNTVDVAGAIKNTGLSKEGANLKSFVTSLCDLAVTPVREFDWLEKTQDNTDMESSKKGIKKKLLTIVYIVKDGQVLLGLKKRGFGAGNWNGFGGKVQEGESIEQAAKRELEEESSLTVDHLQKIGVVDQEFVDDPVILEIHIYRANSYHGDPTESEEMKPQWFDVNKIPFDEMWLDDRQWFPYMLKETPFYAYYLFEGFHKILKENLREVSAADIRSHLDSSR